MTKDDLSQIAKKYRFNYITSFEDEVKITREKIEKQCSRSLEHFNLYLEKIVWLGEHTSNYTFNKEPIVFFGTPELYKLWKMVNYRFNRLPERLAIASYLIRSGFYCEAVLELRYCLESMFQAYYLDQRYPDFSNYEKMFILKGIVSAGAPISHGTRLIEEIKNLGFKNDFKAFYGELSESLHPKHEEAFVWLDNLTVDCDEVTKCVSLYVRTFDVILFLMLNSHPNMKEDFKNDPTVMQYLIDLNANFCQNIVH